MVVDFLVLAATTVTSTGQTVVEGDLGVSPGSAVTGFPPGVVSGGTVHHDDDASRRAKLDAAAEFSRLASLKATKDLTGKDLGGLTLGPGAYRFASSVQLTGKLVLDGSGDFVFIVGSTLTTAEKSSVELVGNARVFWVIGSSATLGTATDFVGDVIARQSITLVTGTKVRGRLTVLAGAVTMDGNHVMLR